MRSSFLISLILVIVLGGIFWFKHADSACLVPISYKIGTIDSRFGVEKNELKEVLKQASEIWGGAAGKDLLIYDETSNFTVNLIFDERQKMARSEEEWRTSLKEKEKAGNEIMLEVKEKNQDYLNRKLALEESFKTYGTDLNNFNEKVDELNSSGGATPEVFAELQIEKERLEKVLADLTESENDLVLLISEINELGKEGNEIIDDYNLGVEEYNERFGNLENFTQGDFKRERINVYKFDNNEELKRVVVHEFGHALGLGHVDDEEAIMYYLTTDKFKISTLTEADILALKEVCVDDKKLLSKLWKFIYYL